MKIVKFDRKRNYLELLPSTFDDLWHLSGVIEKNDIVRGSSERKIKPKEEGVKPFRQKLFVEIEVEKTELSEHGPSLRVSGVLIGGKPEEFIDLKSHHSLEISPNTILKLEKKHLHNWQLERLKKAESSRGTGITTVILDDEYADFYEIRDFRHEHLARIRLAKRGKRFSEEEGKPFEGIKKLLDERKPEFLAIAGPGFEKELLHKFLSENRFAAEIVVISLSSGGITGLNELLKSEAFAKASGRMQIAEETKRIEQLFEALAKDTPHAYGLESVKKAALIGAVAELMVSEEIFHRQREETEAIMQAVEKASGKVHVISSDSEARKKLDAIGGIAALLRYKHE
jgi:protein pelota